jgi:hypothetical protein
MKDPISTTAPKFGKLKGSPQMVRLWSDVLRTREHLDSALAAVPSAPFGKCCPIGRAAWDKVAEAIGQHRAAITLYRVAFAE